MLAKLESLADEKHRLGLARFAIPSDKAFGIRVGTLRTLAKQYGRNHELALKLWETGWLEARLLACFVDDPKLITSEQMDDWCGDFSDWATCDSACFGLFDRTPFAWKKVKLWAKSKHEFTRRAAFALIASLSVHDKKCDDDLFAECLPLIEKASTDERHFVKKGVNWALRSIGKRSPALYDAALAMAQRLAESPDATARWIGKDALRDLRSASSIRRLERQRKK